MNCGHHRAYCEIHNICSSCCECPKKRRGRPPGRPSSERKRVKLARLSTSSDPPTYTESHETDLEFEVPPTPTDPAKEYMRRVSSLYEFFQISRASIYRNGRPEDLSTNTRADQITQQNMKAMCNAARNILYDSCNILWPGNTDVLMKHTLRFIGLEEENMRTVDAMLRWSAEFPARSAIRRTCRALLCENFSRSKMNDINNRLKLQTLNRASYEFARADFRHVEKHEKFKPENRNYIRYKRNVVDAMLKMILSPQFIYLLSWGCRVVKYGGIRTTLPVMVRKVSKTCLWNHYVSVITSMHDDAKRDDKPAPDFVGRTSFFEILSKITSGNRQMMSCSDYIQADLVIFSFSRVENIIRTCVSDDNLRNELSTLALVCRNFLLVQYDTHARISDDTCPLHGINFGLNKSCSEQKASINCNACAFVFLFVQRLYDAVSEQFHEDADRKSKILERIWHLNAKFIAYMAHRLRVVNQQIAIQKLDTEMLDELLHSGKASTVFITADFKMKWLPKHFRESNREFFGKRGISWHAFAIKYYAFERNENGNTVPVHKYMYCDQIVDNDDTQDAFAVISLMEAFFIQLKIECNFVKRVHILTSNASCYQNWFLEWILPLIGARHGLQLCSFIHTETGDGKGAVDRHFGSAAAHVKRYLDSGNDVTTPRQLAMAISSNGGLVGSWLQLVNYDRGVEPKLKNRLFPFYSLVSDFFGRLSEIRYEYDLPNGNTTDGDDSWVDTKMSLYSHSNFASDAKIFVKFDLGRIKIELPGFETLDDVPVDMDLENSSDDDSDSSENDHCDGGDVPRDEVGELKGRAWVNEYTTVLDSEMYMDSGDCESDENLTETEENFDEEVGGGADNNENGIWLEDLAPLLHPPTLSGVSIGGRTVIIRKTSVNTKMPERPPTNPSRKQQEKPKDHEVEKTEDVFAYAIRKANEICANGDADAEAITRDSHAEMPEYLLADGFLVDSRLIPTCGWAMNRDMPTDTNNDDYEAAITKIFEANTKCKGKRLNAATTREKLLKGNMDLMDMPTEQQIKSVLQRLYQKSKKSRKEEEAKKKSKPEPPRKRLLLKYSRYIERLLDENINLSPIFVLCKLQDYFKNGDDPTLNDSTLPDIHQVRNKVKSYRRNLENQHNPGA